VIFHGECDCIQHEAADIYVLCRGKRDFGLVDQDEAVDAEPHHDGALKEDRRCSLRGRLRGRIRRRLSFIVSSCIVGRQLGAHMVEVGNIVIEEMVVVLRESDLGVSQKALAIFLR